MSSFSTVLRWVLTAELFLGGEARLTDKLTPGVHKRAMAKAAGYQRYLPFIPGKDAKQHSQVIGALMCTAGGLMCLPAVRTPGAILSMSLSLAGWYSQSRMGVPYWLPVINTILAAFIIYSERA